jgi:hypothetical protein
MGGSIAGSGQVRAKLKDAFQIMLAIALTLIRNSYLVRDHGVLTVVVGAVLRGK